MKTRVQLWGTTPVVSVYMEGEHYFDAFLQIQLSISSVFVFLEACSFGESKLLLLTPHIGKTFCIIWLRNVLTYYSSSRQGDAPSPFEISQDYPFSSWKKQPVRNEKKKAWMQTCRTVKRT